MRKIDEDLIREAEGYVMDLLENKLPGGYLFHSGKHTKNVLNNAIEIGRNSGLDEDEMNILRISALFHDSGYTASDDNHEAQSCSIAEGFLRSRGVGEPDIIVVVNAILATRVPQHPGDKISEILCDSDLMHLTGTDYFDQMELLRLEWQRTGRTNLTEYQFHLNSIEFFNRHHFHSTYGRTVLQAKKEETLRKVRERADLLAKTS